jgi:hypothetical protein
VAVRKETIKQQFNEALPSMLQPGEQVFWRCVRRLGAEPAMGAGSARAGRVPDLRHALLLRRPYRPAPDLRERPKGLAWVDARDSITIRDLSTDNKLWNWGKISSPTKQDLRMNFHAFWRPELKAMGDLLADRIVGPRLAPGAAGDPLPDAEQAPLVPPPPAPPTGTLPTPPPGSDA